MVFYYKQIRMNFPRSDPVDEDTSLNMMNREVGGIGW